APMESRHWNVPEATKIEIVLYNLLGNIWETNCSYVEARLEECWVFSDYHLSEYWAYADCKYMALLLQDKTLIGTVLCALQDVVWSQFGFLGCSGRDSTLWIDTEGANALCHLNYYGWVLWSLKEKVIHRGLMSERWGYEVRHFRTEILVRIKSNQILFVTYTWLADVNASVAKCLCF
uniref:Uncharacterized protein n=1 Tax=Oncorhynchus tshawytscha TaxID=74940 RepID=A0A8C8BT15_ONCTS